MANRSVLVLALVVALAGPVRAEEGRGMEDGLDLFSEGARRLMEGIVGELGPLLLQLEALIDEVTSYQAPERLPNGDIIIRRRPEAPELPPAGEEGEEPIEL